MSKAFLINSRAEKEGREASFVDSFLKSNNLFKMENLNYMVLKETITDGGIPDIIIVSWDKSLNITWNPERNKLNKVDFKILHFIASKKSRGVRIQFLINKLGYNSRTVDNTIKKLINSNLINLEDKRAYFKEIEDNFFIEEIITIEAKLTNWKKALQQAKLNLNFSSKSYVLIPEKNNAMVDALLSDNITGLITYDGEKTRVRKKAKKNKLPGSYFSWMINEHIGNIVYGG